MVLQEDLLRFLLAFCFNIYTYIFNEVEVFRVFSPWLFSSSDYYTDTSVGNGTARWAAIAVETADDAPVVNSLLLLSNSYLKNVELGFLTCSKVRRIPCFVVRPNRTVTKMRWTNSVSKRVSLSDSLSADSAHFRKLMKNMVIEWILVAWIENCT